MLSAFPWRGDAPASALLSELVQAVAHPWERDEANSPQRSLLPLNVSPSPAIPCSPVVISHLAGSTNVLISCLLVRAGL